MKFRKTIAATATSGVILAFTAVGPAAAGVFGYSQRSFGCWLFPALC